MSWDARKERRSPLKRGLLGSDSTDTASSAAPWPSASSYSVNASPLKKINSGDANGPQNASKHVHAVSAPPSMMDIRAFGLEDRAEAVIAHGSAGGWSMANLAKWRREALGGVQAPVANVGAPAPIDASAAYLKQRQRAYRQQMLARSSPASVQGP